MHSQPAPSVAARLAAGRFSRWSLAVLSLAPFAAAQLGNEVVFVGSSTSGNVDRHHFVESATGTVVAADGVAFTDNVTAAVWADTGRRLYVAQSLQNRVSLAEWSGAQATWSTFHAAAGPCYGLGFDRARQRLWVLAGNSGSAELLGLDADPASVGYGQTVAQTSTLAGVQRERWALSWSGKLALVPGVFLSSPVDVVDLDPASGTYLQVIASLFVPGLGGSFAFTSSCEVSVDDRYLYLLYAGIPGTQGLAVHDLWTQAWLDFDAAPGQQHLALPQPVPNTMDLSLDGSFAVVSGQGGSGWVVRVDFDYSTPSLTAVTSLGVGVSLPDCNGASLSPDQTRVAVTSTPVFLAAPSDLTILDVASGSVLQSTTLTGSWNVYTTAWQDASPIATFEPFGIGCAGSLGAPTLAAGGGTRPALGSNFQLVVDQLPFAVAVVATGLSGSVTSTGLPLPFDLGLLGMTGCTLYADPLTLAVAAGSGSSASWSWQLPSNPAFFGYQLFHQAFALDPAANAFGFTASNAGIATLGL